MYVPPNLAIRLDAIFPSLTSDEIGVMLEMSTALAEEPGELSLCLGENLPNSGSSITHFMDAGWLQVCLSNLISLKISWFSLNRSLLF